MYRDSDVSPRDFKRNNRRSKANRNKGGFSIRTARKMMRGGK